jgi:L-cysteine desulfidase
MFAIFPTYFKQSVVDTKKTSDSLYNSLMFLHFNDNIYNKYHINLMDIHANIMKMIDKNKNMIKNNCEEEDKTDDISVMSDLSDLSDLSSTTYFFDE